MSKDIIEQYLQELELLRKKSIDARCDLIKQYNYDIHKDYRITIFEQIDRILIYHNTNLVFFLNFMRYPQYVNSLFHTTESDSISIASDYIDRNRHSLVLFIQSVLEAYYIEICAALKLASTKTFSNLITILFKGLDIDQNSNWYKANKILSKIRNTIHNNGIHRHPNETIEYRGTIHKFIKDTAHNSASYKNLIMIIYDIIEFLYYIGNKSENIDFINNKNFNDDV